MSPHISQDLLGRVGEGRQNPSLSPLRTTPITYTRALKQSTSLNMFFVCFKWVTFTQLIIPRLYQDLTDSHPIYKDLALLLEDVLVLNHRLPKHSLSAKD